MDKFVSGFVVGAVSLFLLVGLAVGISAVLKGVDPVLQTGIEPATLADPQVSIIECTEEVYINSCYECEEHIARTHVIDLGGSTIIIRDEVRFLGSQ